MDEQPNELDIGKVLRLLDLSQRILGGQIVDPQQIARALVGLALDLAPVEYLAPYLTDEAQRRADLIADIAEAAKYGTR